MNKYIVKPNCVIFHGGIQYSAGIELELADNVAEVHAQNITLVDSEESEPKAKPSRKQPVKKEEPDA